MPYKLLICCSIEKSLSVHHPFCGKCKWHRYYYYPLLLYALSSQYIVVDKHDERRWAVRSSRRVTDTVVLGDGETKQFIEEGVEFQHNSMNIILNII